MLVAWEMRSGVKDCLDSVSIPKRTTMSWSPNPWTIVRIPGGGMELEGKSKLGGTDDLGRTEAEVNSVGQIPQGVAVFPGGAIHRWEPESVKSAC